MSRKWLVAGGCGVAAVACLVVAGGFGHHVASAAMATGAEPTPSGIFAILGPLLGSFGFTVGGIVALVHKWVETSLPAGPTRKLAVSVLDVGQLSQYAQLYAGSKLPAEKDQLRAAAKTASDDLFNQWFPV